MALPMVNMHFLLLSNVNKILTLLKVVSIRILRKMFLLPAVVKNLILCFICIWQVGRQFAIAQNAKLTSKLKC